MTAGELNTQQTRRDDGHAARFPYPLSGTALAMVVTAAVFWAFFTNIANYNLDSYRDMLQNHGWGIRWQWGNSSHPPLFGWITAAWFEVFPRTNLAYRFLASINLALSLCIILLLARRVIEPKRQVVMVAVAILLPLLGFQAQIYNANSAMLPFWALTAYLYVISIERPTALRLAALGFAAALAMLAKYHSAVLLMALTAHAFWFQPARMVLLSPRLLWVIAGFAPLAAMHVHWLFANDFAPIVFAAAEQGETTISNIAFRQIEFFAAQIIYALPGLLALAVLWRPRDTVLSDARAAAAAFFVTATGSVALFVVVGSVVFTMLLGILVWSPLTANWSLPVFLFVTLVFVGCLTPNFEVSRLRPLIVAYGALMLFLLAIA
ncbi:MAG: glycosyltransferase family 39 protein, partial [Pseudomonadota bacterium]